MSLRRATPSPALSAHLRNSRNSRKSKKSGTSNLSASKVALSNTSALYWLSHRGVYLNALRVECNPQQYVITGKERQTIKVLCEEILTPRFRVELWDAKPNKEFGSFGRLFADFFTDVAYKLKSARVTNGLMPCAVEGQQDLTFSDILEAATLSKVLSKRQGLMKAHIKLTHAMNEASWRASIDGFFESGWAHGTSADMIRYEASWRLPDGKYSTTEPMITRWEPSTIRPDVVLAAQTPTGEVKFPDDKYELHESMQKICHHGPHLSALRRQLRLLNTVEKRYYLMYHTIDLSYLIVEYKKDMHGPGSVYQLAMAMTTSLNHFCAMSMVGMGFPVFGVLIERARASVIVGWTDEASGQINIVDLLEPGPGDKFGRPVFDLSTPYGALKFRCFISHVRAYGNTLHEKCSQALGELYMSIIERKPRTLHNWHDADIEEWAKNE